MKWATGVTTIPERRNDLLPRTLASLKAGGFEWPHLFVDGDDDGISWWSEFRLPVTLRSGLAVRCAGNWVLSLAELFWREPDADRFLLAQDDILVYRNLRQYLEACAYPDRGYLNLYTVRESDALIQGQRPGWHEAAELSGGKVFHGKRQQCGRGALALVFDRAAALSLLSNEFLWRKALDPVLGWRRIDGAVVEAMNRAGWREHIHAPSLCDHIGLESSMSKVQGGDGRDDGAPKYRWHPSRCARSFRGESFDAMELLRGHI